MQHDSDIPSAPPDPDDDFEYIGEVPGSVKKPNVNDTDNSHNHNNNNQLPQDFVLPNDMAIPDAIQQQLIFQSIINQQMLNKNAAPKAPSILEEKQAPKQPSIPQPKPSFMAQTIHYPESALFKTAGICVWRPKENGKGIQFMMGLEKQSNTLSFFGGKRDVSDANCIDTAVREFHEETGKKVDAETLCQMKKILQSAEDQCVFWKAEWQSVLYYYQMGYDYDIVSDYNNNKAWNAEITSIYWVDFEKLYKSVFITGNPMKISKNKYGLRSFVVGMLLHEENKKYLLDLHLKHGGNLQNIQPKKGGNIRNTLSTFNNIPKAVRLDILHPITHYVLYHRWIEMNILDIEDYQLLISLISSISPDIGRNFMLYYTANKCFRTSKTQQNIDTIPSFTKLQSLLSKEKKHFVTQIAVLPTFIVSDNLKGISLSFKAHNVSWKHIDTSNDDEKSALSFIYNKASDWAQAWFGDDDDNDNDGGVLLWKWQFMNDKNKFEDFNCANNKHMESCFISGHSFASFKRNGVYYQANYKTMCQKNLTTSNLRALRRVPASVKGDKSAEGSNVMVQQIQNVGYYKWQYQGDKGEWIDYESSISKQLNAFKSNIAHYRGYYGPKPFESRYTMSTRIQMKNLKYNHYMIDVWFKMQKNVSTKKERVVRQIAAHAHKHDILFNNDSNGYKWQYKDDGYENWKDFADKTSEYIEKQYVSNRYCAAFIVTIGLNNSYRIHFNSMQEQSLSSGKYRTIRRELVQVSMKHRWEWMDDNGSYKEYDLYTSQQIENAANSGIKKYFFVSQKNKNSYEITFANMSQYNVQTGKQRKVRKVALKPKWCGVGPNPIEYSGPRGVDRMTFGEKVRDLYCVVGDNVANEVQKSGKLMRATLGPFGAGLYFYDSQWMAQEMAKDRSICNRGNVISAKVFVGKEHDVSNCDDKEYDFISVQKDGNDSISRATGLGTEYIVYNLDQVCIVKVEKYKR